jgi:hypothetical protein
MNYIYKGKYYKFTVLFCNLTNYEPLDLSTCDDVIILCCTKDRKLLKKCHKSELLIPTPVNGKASIELLGKDTAKMIDYNEYVIEGKVIIGKIEIPGKWIIGTAVPFQTQNDHAIN